MARGGPRGLPGGGPRGGPSQKVVAEGNRPNFLLGASPSEIEQHGVSSSNFPAWILPSSFEHFGVTCSTRLGGSPTANFGCEGMSRLPGREHAQTKCREGPEPIAWLGAPAKRPADRVQPKTETPKLITPEPLELQG
jgi:hypothetical protein